MLGLKILSQRTVALAGHALPLIALGLGFWLAWEIRRGPDGYQLGLVALYAVFALAMLWIRRK